MKNIKHLFNFQRNSRRHFVDNFHNFFFHFVFFILIWVFCSSMYFFFFFRTMLSLKTIWIYFHNFFLRNRIRIFKIHIDMLFLINITITLSFESRLMIILLLQYVDKKWFRNIFAIDQNERQTKFIKLQ